MPIEPRWDMTLRFSTDGGEAAVILQYQSAWVPADQSEAIIVADAIGTEFGSVLPSCMGTSVAFLGTDARYLSPGVGYIAQSTVGAATGTVTGDVVPAEVGVIIKKYGSGPPKRANGRNWWPGCPESFTTGSKLNATGKSAFLFLANKVRTTFNPESLGDLVPVVMSRVGLQLYPIQASTTLEVLGHQTRRRPLR